MENKILRKAIEEHKIIKVYLVSDTGKALLYITDGDIVYGKEKDMYFEYDTNTYNPWMNEKSFKAYSQDTRTKNVMNHMKQYIFGTLSVTDEMELLQYMKGRGLVELRDIQKNLGTEFYTEIINSEWSTYIKNL